MKRFLFLLLCVLTTSCSTEIYHDLDEQSANAMIVALEQHGIEADKSPDPAGEATWVVAVQRSAQVEAWRVLEAQGLPRPKVQGFDKLYANAGLIPTANEERIKLQYATAQELRRSLLSIDGVIDASVNLVLPGQARIPLPNAVPKKPRASVLVKYRSSAKGAAASSPVSQDQIKSLVSGGVEGLDPESVSVLLTPEVRSAMPLKAPRIQQVGPIAVSPASKGWLQLIMGLLCLTVVALGALVAYLLVRQKRRHEGV